MNKIDLNKYQDFVEEVTSDESNNSDEMARAIMRLTVQSPNDVNVSLLLTGAVGMSAEGGEFMEIVKKCIFSG